MIYLIHCCICTQHEASSSFTQTIDEGVTPNPIRHLSHKLAWLVMMCILTSFVNAGPSFNNKTFDAQNAWDEYDTEAEATVFDHICTENCEVNCIGKDSCTYRRIQCGTDGNPATCTVRCQWDSAKNNRFWTGSGGQFAGNPNSVYPPCNQAKFTVKKDSHLTLIGEGQGALMLVNVTAEEGSTVTMDVSADWGMMWADIDAENANALDITVQGEGILWDANIGCPATSTGDPNCRITLVTDADEIDDYNLDYYYDSDEYQLMAHDTKTHGKYYLYNYFTQDGEDIFVTALMTGTHIAVGNLANIEVNCEGPDTLNGVLFSEVDDKPGKGFRGDGRSRIPQIVTGTASNSPCELDFTWSEGKDLKCDGQPVRGTCGKSTPATTKEPTASPTTKEPTPSPTVDPIIAWRKRIRELQKANDALPPQKWKQSCAQTKTRLENKLEITGLRRQVLEAQGQVLEARIAELDKPNCTDMEDQVQILRVAIDGLKGKQQPCGNKKKRMQKEWEVKDLMCEIKKIKRSHNSSVSCPHREERKRKLDERIERLDC